MKKDALITVLSMVLASAALSVSCGEEVGRTPTVPTQSPTVPTLGAQRVSVSGRVFEGTLQGDRPIAGAEFEIHSLINAGLGTVASDAAGRYTVGDLVLGTAIALARTSGPAQQCVASTTLTAGADNVLDVELGSAYPSARLSRSPVLSGLIFEQTAAGRQSVPNAAIYYDWDCLDGTPEAGAITDANGRYELCRLPRGGCLIVVSPDGRVASRSVDVLRDTVVDIEVSAR